MTAVPGPQEAAEVGLWRCSACGKWSHAKRKPIRHQRFEVVPAGEGIPLQAVSEDHGWDRDDGSSAFMVWCGPFVEYRARLAEVPR